MAAGNVGYTDTRSFSGSLLGDIASSIRNRTKNAALMARQERAYAEEQAEKQDTSLDEAGIGKGYFFKRALGSTFGGDRIARTRGYFEKNPPMGRDPLGSIESRFRGGFDYGEENLEKPKVVTSKPTSAGGGTTQSAPVQKGSDNKKPLPVKHTRLTVGMLSTFQRLENQLKNITDFVGTGRKDSQAIYALENQKMLLGSVFTKTTNMINAVNKSIGSQTDTIKKIAKNEANKLKQDAIDAAAKSEESGSEGQNAKAGNAITKALNKAKQARSAMSAPGSRLKDVFGPASGMAKGLRNPKAAMRLARMRAKRVFGKSLAKGVTGRAFGKVGKVIAKKTLQKNAAKIAAKGVGKLAVKKVPILGAVAGLAFGIERAIKGDWLGAIGEVASGTASIFPGVGTAISAGIDAALIAKDVNEAMNETPQFAEGGVIQGEDWLGSRISRFENEKLKREMGAKPLDSNFWKEWHTLEFKFDKKNRPEILNQISDGLDYYFFRNGGVKAFVDGMKGVFDNIANFIMNIPGAVGDWLGDRRRDLMGGLRGVFGAGGQYTGPTMTATGGTKITQDMLSRGFGVKDGLGSGSSATGHTGIDISGGPFGKPGSPISFLAPGKVIDVGVIGDANDPGNENGGYGNFVVVETDTGEIVKMGHLQKVNVSKGARVGKDANGNATVIGTVGYTGFTEPKGPGGTHLHLDLGTGYNRGSAAVSGLMDPMPYVNDLIRGGGDVKVTGQQNRPKATTTTSLPPQGSNDIIIPLDHVKPELSGKFPDDESRTSFDQSRATGAAGRERDHQDSAAAKLKTLLEKKGFRVSVIKPESFSSYETYDAYIKAEAAKGTRILPLHFDAKVGQGGTGFLTRTRKGDAADAAFARPIQAALSNFQRANPELGNLGPSDTVSNATINAASASPAALIELGAMVQWEEKYGRNFTNTATFNTLIQSVADAVAVGTPKQASPVFTQSRQINTGTTTQPTGQQIWETWLKGMN